MKDLFSIRTLSLAVLPILVAGCAQYTTVVTETYSIPPNSTVEVSTFNGSITVEWYEGAEMILEITKTSSRSREELDKVEVDITPGLLTIIEAHRLDRYANVGASLMLRLPQGTEISELQTSNGSISVAGGDGTAQVRTSNGSVSFDGFSGSINIETSNGSIFVSGGSLVYAATSNGSITAEIMSIPKDGITLRTSNGRINIEIDSELDADLEMDTSNGSISVTGECFRDVIIDDSDGTATLGEGGAPIKLRTSNGSIRVTAVTP